MQLDRANVIRHADDLQYLVFTLTVLENNFEIRAVTGDEISFQSIRNKKIFQDLLLRLKWPVPPSTNTLNIFETVTFYAIYGGYEWTIRFWKRLEKCLKIRLEHRPTGLHYTKSLSTNGLYLTA